MKKRDLLLSDFETFEVESLIKIVGGASDSTGSSSSHHDGECTNTACTEGDEGCCDTDCSQ